MRTYTKQQVQAILALYKDGKTKREIAEAYGTDIKSVQNLIYYHTIQVPQKERAKPYPLQSAAWRLRKSRREW